MPSYEITLSKEDSNQLLEDLVNNRASISPIYPIARERYHHKNPPCYTLTLNITEEEYLFLKLKYKMIHSKEITIIDVVGAYING